ncbi:MAG: PAS domain S-box protein, partial [Methanoregula sp.]|nr:PAS domain S-box protein [Methanoregula sp.]
MPEAHDRDQIYDTDQPAMERHPNHVLVIEDEESHAELIRRGFKSYHQDFHLTFAGSLMDARNRINKNLPDMIIADWLLPDGKGIEILPSDQEAITIPVIIMTSHGNEELAVGMMKAGVVDYIVKSESSFRELPHIAERALRDWGNIVQRKRAQEALRESEEKFRSLVEHALEGILILDLQGTILFANNATARMIEADDHAGLIGRNVMEFVAPESREDVMKDFIEVSRGRDAYLAHYNAISAKGNKFWVESIGKVISYEGKPADLVSFRDITERKLAEDMIKLALA